MSIEKKGFSLCGSEKTTSPSPNVIGGYGVYHHHDVEAGSMWCGLHAANHILGGPVIDKKSVHKILHAHLKEIGLLCDITKSQLSSSEGLLALDAMMILIEHNKQYSCGPMISSCKKKEASNWKLLIDDQIQQKSDLHGFLVLDSTISLHLSKWVAIVKVHSVWIWQDSELGCAIAMSLTEVTKHLSNLDVTCIISVSKKT